MTDIRVKVEFLSQEGDEEHTVYSTKGEYLIGVDKFDERALNAIGRRVTNSVNWTLHPERQPSFKDLV